MSSTNLNFTDKTVSEVVDLLDGVSGLTAELISNADNSAHTVRITSENTGFENGFRIPEVVQRQTKDGQRLLFQRGTLTLMTLHG